MENHQLILNSNSLCVFCLCAVEGKECKNDLFPLHHLTSKMGINLANVLDIMIVPGVPHPDLERMEVLVDACEECTDLCKKLLYEFQNDVEMENCVKLILHKMEKIKLENEYKNCWSRLVALPAEIVDKLRKEIIEKFHLKPELKSNQSRSGTGAGNIPNLLDIPDLSFDQICSYLSLKDIKNCSTVSKELYRSVFPSLITSSFISFEKQSQLPAIIDFIKAKSNDFKKNVNLFIKSKSFDDSSDSRSALLKLFQECGSHTNHLKLFYGLGSLNLEVVNGFRDNNSIPVLGLGKELLPRLKKLELIYREENYGYFCKNGDMDDEERNDLELDFRKNQIETSLPFIKAVLENSPTLKELKLYNSYHNHTVSRTPFLFKLIGESAQPIDTLEIDEVRIREDGLGYLHSLNLKKVILRGYFEETLSQPLTNFLESQKTSLKHFKLVSQSEYLPHFTFPRMESLETFKLNLWEYQNNTESFSFRTQLPNLKELELYRVNEYFFPLGAEPSTSVKFLRLSSSRYTKDMFLRTVCAFKCLSKLEIPVSSYLNDCWKDMTGLEELTLRSVENPDPEMEMRRAEKRAFFDRIITGLDIQNCSIITDREIQKYEEKYETETKKSLALLTRLRLLRLCRGDYDPSWLLKPTDISCRLVLMKMESLKRIDFCGYCRADLVDVSYKVMAEMRGKMDLCFSGKPVNPEYDSCFDSSDSGSDSDPDPDEI